MDKDVSSNLRKDYADVFASDAGQRVLADIFKFCNVDSQIYVPGDSHGTSFNAGKHRVGQRIQGLLSIAQTEIFDIAKNQTLLRIKTK